jgi:hypothetical protein
MSIADLGVVCFAVQVLLGTALVIGEATGLLRLPYGKFRTGGGVNSRVGLALAYTAPVLVYTALWIEDRGALEAPYHLIVFAAFLFHFIRRICEVCVVNSYSRPTPLSALLSIAIFYSGAAVVCGFFQVRTLAPPSKLLMILGGLTFASGELLNTYHHWLLARIRASGATTYSLPRGGLFRSVANPHYLGEILSFLGYAMMSDLLPVWGTALVVTAYLSARANSTLQWYRRQMPLQIPPGWRRLVPFVY